MAGRRYRDASELTQTDIVMHWTFWIGDHPGLDETTLDYAADAIERFLAVAF